MIHKRQGPLSGIDIPLDKLQWDLYERLRGVWRLAPEDWECYPRVYRNRLADGYVAEVQSKRGEYQDVYQDDSKAVVSFFGVGQKSTVGPVVSNTVHLVLFCNLVRLKPDSIVRPDEEVRMDVYNFFRESACYGFQITDMITGVETCLEEYPGTRRKSLLTKADMHPHHIFRCNLSLEYRP